MSVKVVQIVQSVTAAVLFVVMLFAPSLGRIVQLEPETAPGSRRKLAGVNNARCGKSWSDANSRCGVACDGSTDAPCVPYGEKCWSDLNTSVCQRSGGAGGSRSGGSSGTIVASGNAKLTYYTSYPGCCTNSNADQTECTQYNACQWAGWFAAIDRQLSAAEVQRNDIVAFFKTGSGWSNEFRQRYAGKKIRISVNGGAKVFLAGILDTCADSDCDGCCTRNAGRSGALVDIEINTIKRYLPDSWRTVSSVSYQVLNEKYILK